MKRRINITIDEEMYLAHKLQGKNVSQFVNELLKEKFLQANRENIYEAIKQRLINEGYISEQDNETVTYIEPEHWA